MKGKKRRHIKKSNSFTSLMVKCFLVFFVAVVFINLYSQAKVLYNLKNEEHSISEQIDTEKKKNLELKSNANYYKSDAYIESVARDKLGLVMPGEIVFVNKSK
ncbi:MAG: septum formation initiator family protein [Clostridia bacterium]|jgi:cell division protein FtsB|nr:septum formation initiator family protein [Clostridia bacterium]